MTDLANKLLGDINTEYQNQLDSGINPKQAAIFNNKTFIDKYHYDSKTLNLALKELHDYGYIIKWQIPAFTLIVD